MIPQTLIGWTKILNALKVNTSLAQIGFPSRDVGHFNSEWFILMSSLEKTVIEGFSYSKLELDQLTPPPASRLAFGANLDLDTSEDTRSGTPLPTRTTVHTTVDDEQFDFCIPPPVASSDVENEKESQSESEEMPSPKQKRETESRAQKQDMSDKSEESENSPKAVTHKTPVDQQYQNRAQPESENSPYLSQSRGDTMTNESIPEQGHNSPYWSSGFPDDHYMHFKKQQDQNFTTPLALGEAVPEVLSDSDN